MDGPRLGIYLFTSSKISQIFPCPRKYYPHFIRIYFSLLKKLRLPFSHPSSVQTFHDSPCNDTSGRKEKMKEGSQEARLPREENRLVDGNEDKTSWPPRFDRRGVDRSEGGGQVDSTRRGRALSLSLSYNQPANVFTVERAILGAPFLIPGPTHTTHTHRTIKFGNSIRTGPNLLRFISASKLNGGCTPPQFASLRGDGF